MILVLHALGFPREEVEVCSLDHASEVFSKWIDDKDLGVSDLRGKAGSVYNISGLKIATVSYNGRIWDPRGKLL